MVGLLGTIEHVYVLPGNGSVRSAHGAEGAGGGGLRGPSVGGATGGAQCTKARQSLQKLGAFSQFASGVVMQYAKGKHCEHWPAEPQSGGTEGGGDDGGGANGGGPSGEGGDDGGGGGR